MESCKKICNQILSNKSNFIYFIRDIHQSPLTSYRYFNLFSKYRNELREIELLSKKINPFTNFRIKTPKSSLSETNKKETSD